MTDPGFARLIGNFVHEQNTWLGQYLFYFGGNLLIMLLMFAWDWYKGRLMKQFLQGAGLILVVDITAICLYFNSAWQAFARNWVESIARQH
jgi:hypothetical protein